MTLEEILANITLSQVVGDGLIVTLIVTTLIEITPIKWNPISSLLAWLGTKLNSPILERIENQEKKIDALEEKIDMNELDHIRWEILNFANSCRNDQRHTKDEFDHIISQHDKYSEIIDSRNLTNGVISLEYDFIVKVYEKCMEKNSFL